MRRGETDALRAKEETGKETVCLDDKKTGKPMNKPQETSQTAKKVYEERVTINGKNVVL